MMNRDALTVKVSFLVDKFVCHDLGVQGRIVPPAVGIIDTFVKTLNKRKKQYCVKFPSILYIFIFLYIGCFIGLNAAGLGNYIGFAVIFLVIFIVGIVWYTFSRAKFIKMIQDTCEEFRVQLSPYYTIMNKLTAGRRRVGYGDSGIFFYPVGNRPNPQMNTVMMNQQHAGPLNNRPMPLPNLIGNSPHQNRPYSRNPFQPINNRQGMQNQPVHAYPQMNTEQVYNPPPLIPIYNHDMHKYNGEEENMDTGKNNEEVKLKGKQA